MGSHRGTDDRKPPLSLSKFHLEDLGMKQLLYAGALLALFAASAEATKCKACYETSNSTHYAHPVPCKSDSYPNGVDQKDQECSDRVVGCVSEFIRHKDAGSDTWTEYEMKHCLDPQNERPPPDVARVLAASGVNPRATEGIEVSGCMRYRTTGTDSVAGNEIDTCFCDGDLCNTDKCVCTLGSDNNGNSGNSIAALGALTAVAAAVAKLAV